jgi:hypothetical protein
MHPVSVYANLACPAGCPCDVQRTLRLLAEPRAWTIPRPYQRPLLLPGRGQGRQRHLQRLHGAVAGRLSQCAGGGGDLRQRDRPPFHDRPAGQDSARCTPTAWRSTSTRIATPIDEAPRGRHGSRSPPANKTVVPMSAPAGRTPPSPHAGRGGRGHPDDRRPAGVRLGRAVDDLVSPAELGRGLARWPAQRDGRSGETKRPSRGIEPPASDLKRRGYLVRLLPRDLTK